MTQHFKLIFEDPIVRDADNNVIQGRVGSGPLQVPRIKSLETINKPDANPTPFQPPTTGGNIGTQLQSLFNQFGQGDVGSTLTMEQSIANAISGLGPGQAATPQAPTSQPLGAGSASTQFGSSAQGSTGGSTFVFDPRTGSFLDPSGNPPPNQGRTPTGLTPPPPPPPPPPTGTGFSPGDLTPEEKLRISGFDPSGGASPPPLQPGPGLPDRPQRDTFNPSIAGTTGQFSVDPRDAEKVLASLSNFVNNQFNALVPGLTSGAFTNPNQISGDLQSLFTNTVGAQNFNDFLSQLRGFQGDPQGNAISQQLLGFLGGGGNGQQQNLISSLFDQPSTQGISTNRASEGLFNLMNLQNQRIFGGETPFQNQAGQLTNQRGIEQGLLGQPFQQSLSTGRASDLFQQLQQGGGTGSNLQSFLGNQLQQSIQGGGTSPQTIEAQRERILGPALEALAGRNNRQGGGVASLDSGVFQEINRRFEQDFLRDQQIQASQNLQSQFGQAGQLGQQQFGNLFGVGQAQGQLGQTQQQINQGAIGLGAGLQGQQFQQLLSTLQSQGQLGQNQQQINQQAFGIGGQLQNQLAQQGLQGTQLGLGREQFAGEFQQQNTQQALDFLQLMNLFNLGQTGISGDLTRQLLSGAQGSPDTGSTFRSIMAAISGALSGSNFGR